MVEGIFVYFKCPNCNEITDKVESMHNTNEGGLEANCIHCKKPFALNKTVMVSPQGKNKFKCPHCQKEFEESTEGKDVIQALPDDGKIIKTDTTCMYCNKMFRINDKTILKE